MFNSLKSKGKIVWNLIKPRTRLDFLSVILLLGIVAVGVFVIGRPAYAADLGLADAIMSKIGELFLWLATKCLSLTVFILKFVIQLASYNNYINSSAVTLGWVLVRDVTNMFFVIILMVIAFGTVLGSEQYEWKKLMIKFVMAAVLVNFSRVICGVIIDAAQVFMMTFISGVAAVAGGNLINALKLESILSFSSQNTSAEAMKEMNIVATSIFAFIFAFATVIVMGAYLVVLIGRAVTLWVLVILSPLAFVLSVIPKTQSYAGQWWSEFTNHVIVGPVLAFFLWLTFAVAGGSNINSEFSGNSAYPMTDTATEQAAIEAQGGQTESSGTNLLAIMEMDNLASFIIAVALLLAGVKVSQKLGTVGGEALGAAGGAVKGFAMAATGVAAARWAAKEGWGAAKKTAKFAAMRMPLVGGDAWKRRGMKAAAPLLYGLQSFQQKREITAAELAKKGGIRGVIGRGMMTYEQKEDSAKKTFEKWKLKKEQRKETMGIGGLAEGRALGREAMELKREKMLAEEDKVRGLKFPEEEMLRDEATKGKKGLFGLGGREAAAGLALEADKVKASRMELENAKMIKEAGGYDKLSTQDQQKFIENKQFIDTTAEEVKAVSELTQKGEEEAKKGLLGGAALTAKFEALAAKRAEVGKEKEFIAADNRAQEEIAQLKRIEEVLKRPNIGALSARLHGRIIEKDEAKLDVDRQVSEMTASNYEANGREDLARLERARFASNLMKKNQDDFAPYNYNDFATEAPKQFERLQAAGAAYSKLQGTGGAEEEAARKKYQKEQLRTAGFLSVAMKDASTYQAVEDEGLKAVGYSGIRSPEHRDEMLASLLTGVDMYAKGAGKINDTISQINSGNQHQVNAMLRTIQDNAGALAGRSGNASLTAGVNYDKKTGEYNLGYNSNAAAYQETHANMRDATSAAHMLYMTVGGPEIDIHNENTFVNQVKNADVNNVNRIFTPAFMADMNSRLESVNKGRLQQFLTKMAKEMTDEKAFAALCKRMEKVVKKADIDVEKLYKDIHNPPASA